MIQACTDFIMNVISEGCQLGIVTFARNANVIAHLTLIEDRSSRIALVNALPTSTAYYTCIGCAILEGIEVITQKQNIGYTKTVLTDRNTHRRTRQKGGSIVA